MDTKKRKTISFTVDIEAYEEILEYARIKGHGGQFPTSTFAHYATFQMMKKYPLNTGEKTKYAKRYGKDELRHRAVQPDALESEKQANWHS
jgi:hypothetical protein